MAHTGIVYAGFKFMDNLYTTKVFFVCGKCPLVKSVLCAPDIDVYEKKVIEREFVYCKIDQNASVDGKVRLKNEIREKVSNKRSKEMKRLFEAAGAKKGEKIKCPSGECNFVITGGYEPTNEYRLGVILDEDLGDNDLWFRECQRI